MQASVIETINKLNLSESDGDGRAVRVLWFSAFCIDNKDSLNFRPHNHTFFEAHFVTKGSLSYRFDDGEVEVSAGEMLLIPPHSIHCIVSHTADFDKVTTSFEAEPGTDLFDSLSDVSKRSLSMNEDVVASIEFILRVVAEKRPYLSSIVRNRLIETVFLLAASSPHRPTSRPAYYDPRLLKAKKFIEDNPHMFLSCEEVAQFCRLSPKQLGRLFQQYEGCSLLSFIHGQKIEVAKKMIRETDELFEAIGEKLGFSSVNYFGKFFIRCTGMTPGEYRKATSNGVK